MGAWSTALYGDDIICDVRDSYKHYLRLKHSPEEAVERLLKEFRPDDDFEEDGYLFFLALADTQWKLGHLTLELRRRALDILDSGLDRSRWAEGTASDSDQKRRAVVMDELRERLASPQPAFKKVAPYRPEKPKWEVGDILSIKFGLVELWIKNADQSHIDPVAWSPYIGKYGMAQVAAFFERENTYEQIVDRYAVLSMLDWVGSASAAMDDFNGVFDVITQSHLSPPIYACPVMKPIKRETLENEITLIGHSDQVPERALDSISKLNPNNVNAVRSCSDFYYTAIYNWIKSGREMPEADWIPFRPPFP